VSLLSYLSVHQNGSGSATIERVIEADEKFQASIIEVDLDNLSEDFMATCHQHRMKVMVNYGGQEPDVFQQILRWQPDMINTNHGDIFAKMQNTFSHNPSDSWT
jgi:hypothetical protein